MTHLGVRIFNRVDRELADEFINDHGLFMKYTRDMREAGNGHVFDSLLGVSRCHSVTGHGASYGS